jgi:hypothetical protein
MIPEKLSLTVAGAAVTALPSGSTAGGVSAAARNRHVDVVIVTPDPVVIVVAPPSTPVGRPARDSRAGEGASGYARSAPAPTPPRASGTSGASTAAGAGASSATKRSSGPLAFLDDPKLSLDEKIFRLALYMTDKADKELEKKLEEISGKQKAKSSKSSKGFLGGVLGGGGGGLLGVLGGGGTLSGLGLGLDVLKRLGVTDAVAGLSGPVLAAGVSAAGFPMLAPAAMKLGPTVTQGALAALGELADGASEKASSTTSSKADGNVDKKDLLELEHLQQKQQQLFSLLSNLMKGMHDSRMSVIGNIRT